MALVSDRLSALPRFKAAQRINRVLRMARQHSRVTTILSIVLICACFASATLLQMRRDYQHRLTLADAYTRAQAQTLAGHTARSLQRLAMLGVTYVRVADGFSAAQMVRAAEGDRVLNIALTDLEGRFVTAMQGDAGAATPLPPEVMHHIQRAPLVMPLSDAAIGSSPLALIFRADQTTPSRAVVMPLNPSALLASSTMGETALVTPGGLALASGEGWQTLPVLGLRSEGMARTRLIATEDSDRLVALAPVDGWPLAAAVALPSAVALAGWHQSLPLYLFVLLGPLIAGTLLTIALVPSRAPTRDTSRIRRA
jgi:hypothetical protein